MFWVFLAHQNWWIYSLWLIWGWQWLAFQTLFTGFAGKLLQAAAFLGGNHDLKHPNLKSRLHIVLQTSRIGSLLPSVLMCLLLQRMQMVHSAYLIQPRKKDALKVLLKLLAQSKYSSSSLKVSQSLHCPVAGRCFSLCLNCQINSFFLYCRKSF